MKAPIRWLDSTGGGSSQGLPEQLLVQLPPQPESQTKAKPTSKNYGDGTVLLLMGLSVYALVFFVIKRLQSRKEGQYRLESPRFKHHAACSKCRFFNKNPYIKCAVHPNNVNKIDAKDCPDFWPGDRDKFYKKQDV